MVSPLGSRSKSKKLVLIKWKTKVINMKNQNDGYVKIDRDILKTYMCKNKKTRSPVYWEW